MLRLLYSHCFLDDHVSINEISMYLYLHESPLQVPMATEFWTGWVVSSTLAGATVGSFTGGALADKFGRTRTFQLDAIPLAVGAFLRFALYPCKTMKLD